MSFKSACEGPAFSNGTESHAWMSKWCGYCARDHSMHSDDPSGGCSIILAHMIDHDDWPEAWLPEPDDGQFFLPSRMVCLAFEACHEGGCTGDPGREDRDHRVAEVIAYWQGKPDYWPEGRDMTNEKGTSNEL